MKILKYLTIQRFVFEQVVENFTISRSCSDDGLDGIAHIDDCKKAHEWLAGGDPISTFNDLTNDPDPTRPKGCIFLTGLLVQHSYWNPVETGKRHRDYKEICWLIGKYILIN